VEAIYKEKVSLLWHVKQWRDKMKARLIFHGWVKDEDIPDICIKQGWVRVGFYPPMNIMAHKSDQIVSEDVYQIELNYAGYSYKSMPVFEYEPLPHKEKK
jgi:hypothetical protein